MASAKALCNRIDRRGLVPAALCRHVLEQVLRLGSRVFGLPAPGQGEHPIDRSLEVPGPGVRILLADRQAFVVQLLRLGSVSQLQGGRGRLVQHQG